MKKKFIYITVFILLLGAILLFVNNSSKNKKIFSNVGNNTMDNIISEKNKEINIDNDIINPENYEWVEDFLWYFVKWTWVILNVDLLNENFYINTFTDDSYTVIKFDKKLINEIDKSNNKNIKNQAITDIYNSYKKNKYIYWEPNNERSWIRLLEKNELAPNLIMHNSLLDPYNWESFLERYKRLENKKNKTKEDNQQLSYLYDFAWDYDNALKIKKDEWIKKIKYKISWRVFNLWKSLKWAKIEILNYKNISTITDEEWKYSFEIDTYPLTRLRLRASYNNFSDWYNWIYILFDFNNQFAQNIDFNLHNSDTSVLVKSSDINWGNIKIIKSSLWNEFEFKAWVLLTKDWKKYNWDFNVLIFEFNRNTPWMENFLSLDNFDSVYWYTWNKMITNWMTYLMLFDTNWNELYISKKNPIITRQYSDIKYLLNTKINWTSLLTNTELNLILEKSKEKWYTIDNQFLLDRKISWFAPWWVLNRTRWIWENNPIKLLNKDWFKQSLYYNID